jgi:hypothetical protein
MMIKSIRRSGTSNRQPRYRGRKHHACCRAEALIGVALVACRFAGGEESPDDGEPARVPGLSAARSRW